MSSPILDALQAEAQEQTPPLTAAQWMWAQAGILSHTNMKMPSIEKVIDFINGRLKSRCDLVEGEMNRAAHPFLWPFSTPTGVTLYPDLESSERTRIKERQMSQAADAVRSFVLGDIFTQASDVRAIEKLGDGKPGAVGEAGTLLKAATGSLDPVMKAYGSRDTSGGASGGANMTVTTHQTDPVYPDAVSASSIFWPYGVCR